MEQANFIYFVILKSIFVKDKADFNNINPNVDKRWESKLYTRA